MGRELPLLMSGKKLSLAVFASWIGYIIWFEKLSLLFLIFYLGRLVSASVAKFYFDVIRCRFVRKHYGLTFAGANCDFPFWEPGNWHLCQSVSEVLWLRR